MHASWLESTRRNEMSDANEWNQRIIAEFRANGGQVGEPFVGIPLLLLHTTGARSGLPRINPLVTMLEGDDYVICASRAGAPTNPDWYYNLVANPAVEVEVGTDRFAAQARVADEPERTELYAKVAAKHPMFAEYERKTSRTIPVVVLSRV
jgi:deazaflavin-dependent oxidoreductase (nitroreductase family)